MECLDEWTGRARGLGALTSISCSAFLPNYTSKTGRVWLEQQHRNVLQAAGCFTGLSLSMEQPNSAQLKHQHPRRVGRLSQVDQSTQQAANAGTTCGLELVPVLSEIMHSGSGSIDTAGHSTDWSISIAAMSRQDLGNWWSERGGAPPALPGIGCPPENP
jgi:hypothetical protein